ncbi:hypothetical protein [Mameliella sp. MMSF_3552]|uniref:hypothetical protein n=1 Tax=unclassified Mameliella TaxID=2630630 RepID=UPI0035324546
MDAGTWRAPEGLGTGATILKQAHDVFWSGHIGYFADPEGHVREAAHHPFSTLGPNGEFRWKGYGDD